MLHRALRELPLELLRPLLRGLRRHADSLVPSRLYTAEGSAGCAVGAMLEELRAEPHGLLAAPPPPRRRRPRLAWLLPWPYPRSEPSQTVRDAWPALAREHPRIAHLELVFDNTCEALQGLHSALSDREAARIVGLWMAAETQAEITLRHLEDGAGARGERAAGEASAPSRAAVVDMRLLVRTADRLRELRPWLSEGQATRVVESWIGARGLESRPALVPPEWRAEVERQRRRLGEPATF